MALPQAIPKMLNPGRMPEAEAVPGLTPRGIGLQSHVRQAFRAMQDHRASALIRLRLDDGGNRGQRRQFRTDRGVEIHLITGRGQRHHQGVARISLW